MRSLNNAICTSGEPVSFGCVRNCSITSVFASISSPLPLKNRAPALLISSSTLKIVAHRMQGAKSFYRESCSHGGGFTVCATPSIQAAPHSSRFAVIYQRQELVTRLFVLAKGSQHRARHRRGVLFFHTAHHHAQMPRFNYNSHPFRRQFLLNRFRDLAGQSLLNLQSSRVHVHKPCDLA